MFIFVAPVMGYDSVWVFGDEFVTRSFGEYVQQKDKPLDKKDKYHMSEYYELKGFANSKFLSNDQLMLSRLRNLLITVINKDILLPKAILVVLDDDCNYEGVEVSVTYYRTLQWLTKEYHRIVLAHKDRLPNKSQKYKYPHIIWIEPPTNTKFYNNDLRREFSHALQKSVAPFTEMRTLRLKRVWDYDDTNLYDDNSHRFTETGLATYWRAVNSTFKFWDTSLNHKQPLPEVKSQVHVVHQSNNHRCGHDTIRSFSDSKDRYHWSSATHRNREQHHTVAGRQLPKPPTYF